MILLNACKTWFLSKKRRVLCKKQINVQNLQTWGSAVLHVWKILLKPAHAWWLLQWINATNQCNQSMQPIIATIYPGKNCMHLVFDQISMRPINANNQCKQSMQPINASHLTEQKSIHLVLDWNSMQQINANNQCKQSMQPINANNQCTQSMQPFNANHVTKKKYTSRSVPKINATN